MVGSPQSPKRGGGTMTVYEALSLMIAFAVLVVLVLDHRKK